MSVQDICSLLPMVASSAPAGRREATLHQSRSLVKVWRTAAGRTHCAHPMTEATHAVATAERYRPTPNTVCVTRLLIPLNTGVGVLLYSALSAAGAPVLLCYGLVRGLGAGLAAGIFPQMLGALLGRYLFEKRFGLAWRQYAPVLFAGFLCGVGLISMFALGCLLIAKAVFQLPY